MDHLIRHINVTAKDTILISVVCHSKRYSLPFRFSERIDVIELKNQHIQSM
jgi:hypothetical protein